MQPEPFVFKSRAFSAADLALIREIVDDYGHLGFQELAQTIRRKSLFCRTENSRRFSSMNPASGASAESRLGGKRNAKKT